MPMKSPVVFIVDRNPIHRNLIRYYLESARFGVVHSFPSGEECLYRLNRHAAPDFLVTSLHPGDLEGLDFLRLVLEYSPETRVVFFDHFEEQEIALRLIEEGASDYVARTSDPDAGIAVLLKNLRYLAASKEFQRLS